jgi:glycosyltransferase involved in cell wall biosynthesis
MKVSVIIPVYNAEKYIEECLNSVVNQTLNDIEIICINDGSTDKSLEILRRYKKANSNIKIINQKNCGVSESRNLGVRMAKGEYIFFLDSDDYIELNLLDKCYNEAKKDDLDIVLFDFKNLYNYSLEDLNTNKFKNISRHNVLDNSVMSGEKAFNFMIQKNVEGWWTCCIHFFKKKFLYDIKLEFNNSIMHEDILYISNAMLKARYVKYIEESLYNYRRRVDSRSNRNKEEKYIDGHYLSAKILQNTLTDRGFEQKNTLENLEQYIKYFYKRAILDCDQSLNLKKRLEICNDNDLDRTDIEISMQINSPNLYYRNVPIRLKNYR